MNFCVAMLSEHLEDSYEFAHLLLVIECTGAMQERKNLLERGLLDPLPEASQAAADKLYTDTAARLYEGLVKTLDGYANSTDPHKAKVYELWTAAAKQE